MFSFKRVCANRSTYDIEVSRGCIRTTHAYSPACSRGTLRSYVDWSAQRRMMSNHRLYEHSQVTPLRFKMVNIRWRQTPTSNALMNTGFDVKLTLKNGPLIKIYCDGCLCTSVSFFILLFSQSLSEDAESPRARFHQTTCS